MDQVAAGVTLEDGSSGGPTGSALREVERFGTNPGNLRMFVASPPASRPQAPLVVVLPGCTQTAAGYDAASGWSRLAAEHGFVVVYAEQRRANNDQTCFSWFRPADIARIGGEAESIRQMVAEATARLGVDARRVYVCGFSAGGAMACAMSATYPEVFAAGAVIAGLPYGCAGNLGEAFEAMNRGIAKDARTWGGLVRAASGGHPGRWPSVAIWQGSADRVVKPTNAGELVKQWTDVHGLAGAAPVEDRVDSATRRTWRDADGRASVTEYTVPGLGHAVPVDAAGSPALFFLPSSLDSTAQIAADFGLTAPATSVVQRLMSMIGLAGD